jgi:hypothetical protein
MVSPHARWTISMQILGNPMAAECKDTRSREQRIDINPSIGHRACERISFRRAQHERPGNSAKRGRALRVQIL